MIQIKLDKREGTATTNYGITGPTMFSFRLPFLFCWLDNYESPAAISTSPASGRWAADLPCNDGGGNDRPQLEAVAQREEGSGGREDGWPAEEKGGSDRWQLYCHVI